MFFGSFAFLTFRFDLFALNVYNIYNGFPLVCSNGELNKTMCRGVVVSGRVGQAPVLHLHFAMNELY